jgi:quinol monooxygenase YgiN
MTRTWFLATALFLAMALLLLATPGVVAQPDTAPIVADVKSQLKDPTKPFTMFVTLQVKDGMQAKFEAAFAKASKATRKEKGALAYDLNHDAKDATRYIVYERWKSLADLEAHLKSPHITALLTELKELLTGPPELRVAVPAAE